jgi:hypothetical protein
MKVELNINYFDHKYSFGEGQYSDDNENIKDFDNKIIEQIELLFHEVLKADPSLSFVDKYRCRAEDKYGSYFDDEFEKDWLAIEINPEAIKEHFSYLYDNFDDWLYVHVGILNCNPTIIFGEKEVTYFFSINIYA